MVIFAKFKENSLVQDLGVTALGVVCGGMDTNKSGFRFERLEVWQKAKELATYIYQITKNWPTEEKYGLISQTTRAAVSISANIAEGSARFTKKEKIRFYELAFGSNIEVINHLIIAGELNLCAEDEVNKIRLIGMEISKMLSGLIKNCQEYTPNP